MNKFLLIQKLGFIDYLVTWRYQKKIFEFLLYKKKTILKYIGYLLFAEHFQSYTLGKSGNINNILLSNDQLNDIGIYFYNSDRGGDITYHGLGQLIIYPILDIEYIITDIHKYIRMLEDVVINLLVKYSLLGKRSSGESGVWINSNKLIQQKLCSLGIRMNRWVVMHGLALNINTDLQYFNYIIPCGIFRKGVSSIQQELGYKITFSEIIEKFIIIFSDIFKIKIHYFTTSNFN